LGMTALSIGCAKEPTAEIEGARQAMAALQPAEADVYAPEALAQARDSQALLDAELQVQQDKFGFMRSYDRTKQLAASAKSTAERAATEAESAKEQARNEATTMLEELRTSVEEIKTLLAEAPTGKGTQLDLAALQTDLGQVEIAATEAGSALDAGRYRDAKAKLEAAKLSGERIKSDIVAAMQARTAARARRG